MNTFYRTVILIGLLVLATPAWAHAPIMGIGGVFGGLLHALLIPEHGMSLVALGLVLGREQQSERRLGVLIFAIALTIGLVVTAFGVGAALAADVLLVATCILALLVAAAWVPPILGWVLAAITGVAFALDSMPEATSAEETIRMLIGSGLGGAIALMILAEGAAFLKGHAQRIVVRVVGSWIAAIAILVVALRIVTRITVG